MVLALSTDEIENLQMQNSQCGSENFYQELFAQWLVATEGVEVLPRP
jgi:hypothetical protein